MYYIICAHQVMVTVDLTQADYTKIEYLFSQSHCVLCKVSGPGYGYHYELWQM
jgi:hypothetical protein